MEKPYDIQERAFLFACDIVDFYRPIVAGRPFVRELGRQLLKAGTSVGANLEEADAGESKPDFRTRSPSHAKSAARAAIGSGSSLTPTSESSAGDSPDSEASELVAILTAIKKNSEADDDRGS